METPTYRPSLARLAARLALGLGLALALVLVTTATWALAHYGRA